jgi:hypothetical protein
MSNPGTTTINFGATPVDSATFTITDAALAGLTYGEAFFMGSDSTADNNATLHRQAGATLQATCDAPVGNDMAVTVRSLMGLVTGQFQLRYVAK